MKSYKSYKMKLYPTKEQATKINQILGACRFVYNMCLGYKQDLYKHNKEHNLKGTVSTYDLQKNLTEIKKIEEYSWLKEMDSQALNKSIDDLDSAYQNFYSKLKQGKKTSLKFKSKKNPKNSYTTTNITNGIRIENNKIKLPKLKFVKFRDKRSLKENERIIRATISRTNTNEYFVSILIEYNFVENKPNEINQDRVFGADMSAKNFMVSEQVEFENQKFYRKSERRLGIRQRKLSNKVFGSKNYEKQKLRVARTHRDITNKRKGFQKNLAFILVKSFDALAFEDLNMKAMQMFSGGLSKTVSLDFSWSEFLNQVEWQAFKQNKHFVKVSRWFASSKTCNCCGTINPDLELSDRVYTCSCGYVADRDVNATRNIRQEGIRLLTEKGINLLKNSTVEPTESNACKVNDGTEVGFSTSVPSISVQEKSL